MTWYRMRPWNNQTLLPKLLFGLFGAAASAAIIAAGAIDPPLIAQVASQLSPAEISDRQIEDGRKLFFEVATVKPNLSASLPEVNFTLGPGDAYSDTQRRFHARNISLLDYIRFAYKLTDGQVKILKKSAPKWIETKRFDIEARSAIANTTKNEMRLMMQSLLTDRFKLRAHSEIRELAVLALVLAKPGKLGPQIHPHLATDDKCSNATASTDQRSRSEPALGIPEICGGLVSVGVPSAVSRRQVPLALMAAHLGEMGGFGRPIVDQTGLSGTFDFTLEWGPDSTTEPLGVNDRQIYLLEALKEQLGLKLESRNSPLAVLLIDHIDQRPTEN